MLKNCGALLRNDPEGGVLDMKQIIRHGETPANLNILYPSNQNNSSDPYDPDQITKVGKKKSFNVGKYLLQKYKKFIGPYNAKELEASSLDSNRAKQTLLTLLAGLYPPKTDQIWNLALLWQPIIYKSLPASQDQILQGNACPNYKKKYREYSRTPTAQEQLNKFLPALEFASEMTGRDFTRNYLMGVGLYSTSQLLDTYRVTLPKWTREIYPQPLEKLAILDRFFQTGTPELRKLSVGYLLEKIVNDTNAKINGTSKTKVHLYSAHGNAVANFLTALDLPFENELNFASYIVIEVVKIQGAIGVKIYFEDYKMKSPVLLTLPNCTEFCPWASFVGIVSQYFPEEGLCEI